LGFDPKSNPNVKIIPFSELIRRFIPPSSIPGYVIDRGISECIISQSACECYELEQNYESRKRDGNFWLDIFNFDRHVDIKGWQFNALILVNNDFVIYKLTWGEPHKKGLKVSITHLGHFKVLTFRNSFHEWEIVLIARHSTASNLHHLTLKPKGTH
jgi:hypothetical protein